MAANVVSSDSTTFWNNVEKTQSFYEPDQPVIIMGKLVTQKAEDLRNVMFRSCTQTEKYAEEFFAGPPNKVLDLGSGMGVNSIPMAKRGALVTAIDCSKELLEIFSDKCAKEGCPKENVRLRCGNLATAKSYGENFDLVIAVDVLPYIAPKDLKSTMEKIHRCLSDKGILIGTIATKLETKPLAMLLNGKLGGHFYEGGRSFVVQLLKESGFSVEKIEEREEGGFRFKATKVSIPT